MFIGNLQMEKKKALMGAGAPSSCWLPAPGEGVSLGRGSPAAWHLQSPPVPLSLAPGPAGP